MYYKDGKDLPYLFQPLGSIVVGYMGKVFSLDINNTFLLSRLVLTFIVFILIYCFVFSLARDKLVALCGATVIILAESVLSSSGITQLLHGASPDNFLRIARPVNPAMIYVLFFGFLASFVSFYRQRNWRSGVLSVVLLGLNFYNYFYTWTYLYAFGGFLVLLLLLQKQWLRAIAMDTNIILLDEPFAGLFPEIIKLVVETIKTLKKQGKTIVLIEHNMDLIRSLCDHLIVLDAGKILAIGTPEKVLKQQNVIEAYLGV
jgi:hypothetical protein